MPAPERPWFHNLAESVSSLGAAAREFRAAHQTAQTASWHTDPFRLLPVDGLVSVQGRYCTHPHDAALKQLKDLYQGIESRAKSLYENTALAYAYGTGAAVTAVLRGERPRHIALGRRDGLYVWSGSLAPDCRGDLGDWMGAPHLVALREIVIEHERAREVANEFDFYEDLAEVECAERTQASEFASGLADAAYAYGEQVERALHFVLMGAKGNHIPEEDQR